MIKILGTDEQIEKMRKILREPINEVSCLKFVTKKLFLPMEYPMTIQLFDTEEDYKKEAPDNAKQSGACYIKSKNTILLSLDLFSKRPGRIIHEMGHASLYNHGVQNLPIQLEEMICQWLEVEWI